MRRALLFLGSLLLASGGLAFAVSITHTISSRLLRNTAVELVEYVKGRPKDIEAGPFYSSRCRGKDGSSTNEYWIVVELTNHDPNRWAVGDALAEFLDSGGTSVGAIRSSDFKLPPGDAGMWFADPDLLSRYPSELRGRPAQVFMVYSLGWFRADGSEGLYDWTPTVVAHSIDSGPIPRHAVTVSIANNGSAVMYQAKIMAIVLDTRDQLVDVLWSEKPTRWAVGVDIGPGETREVVLESLSETGRCLGAVDPNGYSLVYWIYGTTSSGQPFSGRHEALLP